MDQVTSGAAIIGIVGFVKNQFPQVKGIYAFALAVALGLGFGTFGLFGLDLTTGLLTALASSGVYTVAIKAGGK